MADPHSVTWCAGSIWSFPDKCFKPRTFANNGMCTGTVIESTI